MRRSLFLLLAGALYASALSAADAELPSSELLIKANALLAQGHSSSISSAIEHFDVVLQRDAGDYLTLYKRATAYLAGRQSKRALDDFEAVLKLAEFDQVRLLTLSRCS
jgi:DnaJ family protein C protein 3